MLSKADAAIFHDTVMILIYIYIHIQFLIFSNDNCLSFLYVLYVCLFVHSFVYLFVCLFVRLDRMKSMKWPLCSFFVLSLFV